MKTIKRFKLLKLKMLFICLMLSFGFIGAQNAYSVGPGDVVINEIRIDQTSTDNDEYFELVGDPGTLLDGLTYLVIGDGTGGSGVIEAVVDLTGQSIPNSGFFVAAEGTFTLGIATLTTDLNFENSDNVTHLLVQGFTGSNGDDLDTDDDGILDVTPWTAIVDIIALVEEENPPASTEFHYGPPSIGPDGSFVPGHVFRSPDRTGDFQIGQFDPANGDDTPGAPNASVEPPISLTIMEIQGAGHISPYEDQTVTTTGIVTAVDTNGFYMQDPVGDNNVTTSDGIFVFTSSTPQVALADEVEVTGDVEEYIPGGGSTNNLSITEISQPDVQVKSSNNSIPQPLILGRGGRIPPNKIIDDDIFSSFDPENDGIDFFESIEGMLVTVQKALAVSPTNSFGEIFTVVDNGARATGLSRRKTINISPEDFNPERVQIQFDSGILPDFSVDVNVRDKLGNITGVVDYSFGNYEVKVTEEFNPVSADLQQEKTKLKPRKKRVTIATFNVLNLDPNDEDGDSDIENGRFDAIADIIINNLKAPDIITLQEVQDNDGSINSAITSADETLQLLVDKIADISDKNYQFIDNPFIGDDTNGGQPGGNIRTAFLYNPERISIKEDSITTVTDPGNQQTDPDNPFYDSRLPLAVTFLFRNREITIINNHFSSKGGSAPLFGQIQPSVALQEDPDVNGGVDIRNQQAELVKTFVDNILLKNSRANVVVLGDFNEFEFISPLITLEESLKNLTKKLPKKERYSYIYEGNSQSLDHILVSKKLRKRARFDIVHVNTEFTETDR